MCLPQQTSFNINEKHIKKFQISTRKSIILSKPELIEIGSTWLS